MGEPEELVVEAAHWATERAVHLWRRHRADRPEQGVALSDVTERLSLFLDALVGLAPPLVPADPPRHPGVIRRLLLRIPAFLIRAEAVPSNDGVRIRLPRRADDLDRYRLWAVAQALRIARGTAEAVAVADSDEAKWLLALEEARAVDAAIAREFPGLRGVLAAERRRALAARPDPDDLTAREAWIEERIRAALAAPAVAAEGPEAPAGAFLARARAALADLPGGSFRGLPPVLAWGRTDPPGPPLREGSEAGEAPISPPGARTRPVKRRPKVRQPEEGEDDDGPGMFMVPRDDLEETAQDPKGMQRPTDREDLDLDDLSAAFEDLDEARLVRTADRPREVMTSGDPPPHQAWTSQGRPVDGLRYPEWDHRKGAYRMDGAVVRPGEASSDDRGWAARATAEQGRLIRRVRRCFERLQPRPRWHPRQPDGPEVDLDAYVQSFGDRRAGCAVDDRMYRAWEPGRRDLALGLLVDVSASTDSWVTADQRIIDVEKKALLVLCEALDALGDPWALQAFSSHGPQAVSVTDLKGFREAYDGQVRRRIGSLRPDRYTRTGAALRHATAGLARQAVDHRLLLLLSDGKPNDHDLYEGAYGVEDTRQAVVEARKQGIEVFCLTVDRHATSYLPRIFGPSGHAVLRRPERLPTVLTDLVARLLRT